MTLVVDIRHWLDELARTLKEHRDGILAAIPWGVSNSKLEGINNRIGVLKHRAASSRAPSPTRSSYGATHE